MTTPLKILPCPSCKANESSPDRSIWPFCSERCKERDLGAWAMEKYFIAGPAAEDEQNDESESDLVSTH